MNNAALKLIIDEHQALARVLCALRDTVANARSSDVSPDFEQVRAMLFYLDEIPARLHHAAEEEMLFPRIRERCPALHPVLDRLQTEHGRCETTVQGLERALTAWEIMGEERREAFELSLRMYVRQYLGHIDVEESYVLSVAQDCLSAADWRDLHAALTDQRGALTANTAAGHRALLQRILSGCASVPPEGD